ncbi:holo-ACP synthase [Candidatus Pelagibacter sp.]|jgi:holo-[acyl-carrier protein] synthase|uniref:holo-ACP synthase n=1 Tax=Candidatus Pelagibacter sp. TaxID=2024849 RepID=UPI003F859C01
MKIIGIGVDIVENDRMRKATKNKDFIKRIFTKNEINLSKLEKNNIGFYAKRFAAKEAFAKSLGTGFRKGLNFKDIEILNDNLGKPYFNINNKLKKILKRLTKINSFNFFLSLSDEKSYSVAFVTIQTK